MAPRRAGPGSGALFTLKLLGSPEVVDQEGNTVQGIPARGYGLLAYSALQPRPQPRHHLAGLLWPRADNKKGQHSLRQLLCTLRKRMPGVVMADTEIVSIQPGLMDLDLRSLEADLLDGDLLPRALERWWGPFMDRWAPDVSWELEEWVERMRSRVELLLRTSVAETSKGLLVSGRPREAEALLSKTTDLIPDQDDLILLHARALAACGQLPQAEAILIEVELERDDHRVQATLDELKRWKVVTLPAQFRGTRRVEA